MGKGLGNPAAIAAIASTDQGKQAIAQTGNAIKIIFTLAGVYLGGSLLLKQVKKIIAQKYAKANIGKPHVLAAAIIHESFSRLTPGGIFGLILPEVNLFTDESALNNIATQITDIKMVDEAYSTLFDRNLFFDTQGGLDTEEMQTFWNTITATSGSIDPNGPAATPGATYFAVGNKLYSAVKPGQINVNTAQQDDNGYWYGTENLFGNFNFNEFVGTVIATGIVPEGHGTATGKQYYIVEESGTFTDTCYINCKKGVVLHEQVKIKQT